MSGRQLLKIGIDWREMQFGGGSLGKGLVVVVHAAAG